MKRKLKQDLRNEIRRVLVNLDARWLRAASVEVCNNLEKFLGEEVAAEHVLAWVPSFPGEPDLSAFIASQLPHRKVYLPRASSDGVLTFRSIDERWSSELRPGYGGILEPPEEYGDPFDDRFATETVAIVPGLAFDSRGHRLGRGKGYYDRFLGRGSLQGIVRIGVGWSLQIVGSVPTDEFDVPLHYLCHERGVIAAS